MQLEFKSIIKRLGLSEVVQFEFVQQRTDIPDVEQKELESISQIRSKEIPLMFVQGEKCFYLYDQESNTVFITSNKLLIEEILKSDTVKIMYDLKNIFHQLNLEDTNNIKNCEDVMIASYVLDSTRSSYELETLFVSYLNTDIEAVKKTRR